MTREQFHHLRVGQVIRHAGMGEAYTVIAKHNDGSFSVARTVNASNPIEWELLPQHPANAGSDLCRTQTRAVIFVGPNQVSK